MSEPIYAVAGMPRTGTSMLMAMLYAGGLEVYADPPSGGFEHPDSLRLPDDWRWLEEARGRAVKILEPHRHTPPSSLRYRAIWTVRSLDEQEASTRKLMRATLGLSRRELPSRKKLRRSLAVDRRQAFRAIEAAAGPGNVLRVRFEDVIADPSGQAARIAAFVDRGLDSEAMAAAVLHRSPRCLPFLAEGLAL